MNNCVDAARKKITEYLECLQSQICFVNDCLIGIDSIKTANVKPVKKAVTIGFIKTAFCAMQDDVIITLSKLFDDLNSEDTICINNFISVLNKNKHCLSENWQKENYDIYCDKYKITAYIIRLEPSHLFYSIEKAIDIFEEACNQHKSIITNIHKQRNKYYAHNDKKYVTEKKFRKMEQKYSINRQDIEKVLAEASLFLHRIAMATGNELQYKHSIFADNLKDLIS